MRIGLTGSMAAGKSTVSAILRGLGFYIVDADKTAHGALAFPEVIAELSSAFGSDILEERGGVDRKALAKIAFASDENTAALNSIVHPHVFEAMLREADEAEASGREHIVFDVPLLFETGFERYCARLLCVIADDETRYTRIMLRDGLSREEAAARLAKQMSQEEKAACSDAVIVNNGTGAELEEAVMKALEHIGISPEAEDRLNQTELESYLTDDYDN
ncbi:MAG: dephospho-CoA kinase [Clostridia bacterium]|nr:dephospho-CoA kinase [Clostridia bacterium]